LIVHHADWVLSIAGPPVPNGWVAINQGRIAGCGDGGPAPTGEAGMRPFPDGPFAILPALANAHTHVELSWMRGRVPPSEQFAEWIRALVALRRQNPDSAAPEIVDAMRDALAQARAAGTGLFGDISNTLGTVALFNGSEVAAHVFYELIGFNTPNHDDQVRHARAKLNAIDDPNRSVRASLAPHGPYSVSPALFRAIRRDLDAHPHAVSSVHLAESREEVEFLRDGSGPIRAALEALGAWNPEWTPPACGPVEYIGRCGLLHRRVLLVHCVQLTDDELQAVKAHDATIVTCPRSNRWTGAGTPPIARFYASGVRVAVGTDSLAGVEDLNLFGELPVIRALAPDVPAAKILESATRTGAEALGFGDELGTIEAGKRADLIAVRIPPGVQDVEEYLLTGIAPADIRWLCEP
jgi:cytosine/adenosine deaminase-related metal-dependent hydrolase